MANDESIMNGFSELLYPTRCVCCDKPGELICEQCLTTLPWIDQSTACEICGAPYGGIICTECWTGKGKEHFHFDAARAALEFDGNAPKLVTTYKDMGERRLSPILARLIQGAIPTQWLSEVEAIVYIPASKDAFARRGFDHMKAVAAELSAVLAIPCENILIKKESLDQRDLSRLEREENVEGKFELRHELFGGAKSVLLIDDVFTTGATLNSAAETLKSVGVKRVHVAVVCRVW
jgi:ComF family protein